MNIEPIRKEHWDGIAKAFPHSPLSSDAERERVLDNSMNFVLERDGEILVIGGVIPLWEGVAEVWIDLADEHKLRSGYRIARSIRKFVEAMARQLDLQRLQMTCEEGEFGAIRFAGFVGFKYEGTMPFYGSDGETHLRYGKYYVRNSIINS